MATPSAGSPPAAHLEVDDILGRIDVMDTEETPIKGFSKENRLAAFLFSLLSIGLLVFTYYSAAISPMPAFVQRAAHLAFIICLCGLVYPSGLRVLARHKRIEEGLNLLMMGIGVLCLLYLVFNWKQLYTSDITLFDQAVALLVVLVVLEITRRSIGMTLVLIVLFGVAYAMLGPHLPEIISHRGYTLKRILSQIAVGTEGLFGSTLGIASTYVAGFIFFAGFLEAFGGLRVFMKLALSISGALAGGPAKIAVIASGFFAMISGSTVANVVSTGSITIPLMRRLGYQNSWAGAVEAVASTGGTITPPVMGATAFILAEFMGISYIEVMKAAVIPSFLYYAGLFAAVHAQSRKFGFTGLPREKLPDLKSALLRSAHLILPILLLVYLLIEQYVPITAALYASIALFLMAFLSPETRPSWPRILRASKAACKAMVVVSAACAAAGIVIAVLNLTGLGFKLSSIIVSISGGNLFAALLLTQAAAVVLGMGLVTPAVYALLAVLVAPGLVKLGIPPMSAHMFIFFCSALAPITPPVALAAYAAAGLAESSPFAVCMNAVKLGLVAFFLPYFFVYNSSLLFMGDYLDVSGHFMTALIGVCVLGFATQGFLRRPLSRIEQAVFLVLALLLIVPDLILSIIGLVGLIVAGLTTSKKSTGKSTHETTPA
ncbi:MAG: TRAP transporter fused permease subunit [Desulfobacterales bacterium]|jgi:TRAP transporter 4TM/12TM fusion protein|nr:TRAP transporter fused permease subunit [Desulfobacterales bacterium]